MHKRVDRKVKPVPGVFPEDARVTRTIPRDPLLTLPELPHCPPDFTPGERMGFEELKLLNINSNGDLWDEEVKLIQYVMKLNETAFAFKEEQRGTFSREYFSDYIIPVLPHVPWEHKNIPIPPGIRDEVIQFLKDKCAAGTYEDSQASYHCRWFCFIVSNRSMP
ncbi:hypothetical protein BD410DRAFT_813898 [Rickenella mellea]|uniref:Uncharacterized protein n=1 Tax=Rickenella mellea TaxID=50990 RepID=A0A4Y7QC54_9AGAM|nr:hypothetical protein BD410DRAFT_813898 [Rickenella mellea]